MTLRDKIARIVTLDHIQLLTDYDVDADLYRTDPEALESANATADAILSVIAESVVPLAWEYHPAGEMAADNIGKSYIIDTRGKRPTFLKWPQGFAPEINSLDAAKAAAQADYTRRILSALGLSTPEQEKGE